MKNFLFLISTLIFLLFSEGCKDDVDISGSESARLSFTNDTILFDTLLTSRGSITRRFRIYNNNREAIRISLIRVAGGERSPYSLIVNGKTGNSIEDEILLGKDSLLVLVSALIDPTVRTTPFLVKDSLFIEWNGNQEKIRMIAWGQNANFLSGDIICDETWTADLPYVIAGDILIDSLCSLTIEKGSHIYFDKDVSIFVKGSLIVNGDSGQHVLFRNSRLDESYEISPGQWDGIYFLEGSNNNYIQYATIENGISGLRIGTPDADTIPDLEVKNTIIRHMSQTAVQAYTSDAYFENCLFYNAGQSILFHAAGGSYSYIHCTMSNFPNFFVGESPAYVFADNLILNNNQTLVEELQFEIVNSILWGEGENELLISISNEATARAWIYNNIIRGSQSIDNNFFSLQNNFPGFQEAVSFNFKPDSSSRAVDAGVVGLVNIDIEGKLRDELPDIGAYEY